MQRKFLAAMGLALVASGCASGPPFIDAMQPKAIAMAENRARFELNCPTATGAVLNRQQLEPLLFGGPLRASYTIGISGCDKRATVTVLCSENNDQCIEGR
jgi:hypothetical protein